MAIPASEIVQVNPRLITAGGNDLQINGLIFSENAAIPVSSVLTFSTPESVGEYFGLTAQEYKLASIYFRGYDNSAAKPARLYFAPRVSAAAGAWLRSAPLNIKLADLKKITDGAMAITIDGTATAITAVDFSAATSFSSAAEILQASFKTAGSDAAVTFSAVQNTFQISAPTTGAESSIDYAEPGAAGTDLSVVFGLTASAGAVLSQGSAALTVAQAIEAARAQSQNWATFTTTYEPANAEAVEFAQWASAQGVDYLYVAWTTNPAALVAGSEDMAAALAEANAGATTLIYGGAEYAAFIMGTAASIDWNQTNGAINFAFKSQSGLAPTVTSAAKATTLLDKKVNFYGDYATRNDSFIFLYNGAMFGDYGFIDPFINAIWLNNAIQLNILNGLNQAGRVPYTDEGYTLIRSWLMDPIERALNNGVIDPGLNLSQSQESEIIRQAGTNIIAELTNEGYYIQIKDAAPAVRAQRGSPTINIWYTYGGSVNKIVIASTAIV